MEPLWRKTHLSVHLLYLKDPLVNLNNAVRDVMAAYFSHLVAKSRGNPKVLFDTIRHVITLALFLLEKINNARIFPPSASSLSVPTPVQPVILESFSPVSLPELVKLVTIIQ